MAKLGTFQGLALQLGAVAPDRVQGGFAHHCVEGPLTWSGGEGTKWTSRGSAKIVACGVVNYQN